MTKTVSQIPEHDDRFLRKKGNNMQSILIADKILPVNLFNEDGYDGVASAHNLAKWYEAEYRKAAGTRWPWATIEVEVGIQQESGWMGDVSATGIDDGGDLVDLSDEIQDIKEGLEEALESLEYSWAVKLG